MSRRFRAAATIGWWILIAVPPLLIVLAIWPGLGAYGQGLLPEMLAPESTAGGDFEDLARLVRLWCGVALGLSCLIGLIFWSSLRRKWRQLLRHFDASKLLGYRGLVWRGRLVWTLICGAVLGAALMAVAPPMRGLSAAAWVVTIALCAASALLQYLATVFGASETRHLHAGR